MSSLVQLFYLFFIWHKICHPWYSCFIYSSSDIKYLSSLVQLFYLFFIWHKISVILGTAAKLALNVCFLAFHLFPILFVYHWYLGCESINIQIILSSFISTHFLLVIKQALCSVIDLKLFVFISETKLIQVSIYVQ